MRNAARISILISSRCLAMPARISSEFLMSFRIMSMSDTGTADPFGLFADAHGLVVGRIVLVLPLRAIDVSSCLIVFWIAARSASLASDSKALCKARSFLNPRNSDRICLRVFLILAPLFERQLLIDRKRFTGQHAQRVGQTLQLFSLGAKVGFLFDVGHGPIHPGGFVCDCARHRRRP